MIFVTERDSLVEEREASVIQRNVESRLRSSAYLELHNLTCSYREGVLRLGGCVSRYYLLQVALSLVQGVDGVDALDNQVAVIDGHNLRNA